MKAERIKLFENNRVRAVYIICSVITIFTMVAVGIIALKAEEMGFTRVLEQLGLCIAGISLFNLPIIIRIKLKLRIPPFMQIIITIFAMAHFVFGKIYGLYDSSIVFDKVLHTTSGVMFCIYAFSLINALNERDKPLFKLSPFFVVLFALCFSLAIGYVWELIEYSVDSIFGMNAQRWQDSYYVTAINGEERTISDYGQGRGLIDTMNDMIVNFIGALAVSVLGYVALRRKSRVIERLLITRIERDLSQQKELVTER